MRRRRPPCGPARPDHLLRCALPAALPRAGQGRRRGAHRARRLHRPTGEAHWEVLLRARAIETGGFVLAAAQGGRPRGRPRHLGPRLVVAPWGRVWPKLDHDEPGVLLADLDLASGRQGGAAAIPDARHSAAFPGAEGGRRGRHDPLRPHLRRSTTSKAGSGPSKRLRRPAGARTGGMPGLRLQGGAQADHGPGRRGRDEAAVRGRAAAPLPGSEGRDGGS